MLVSSVIGFPVRYEKSSGADGRIHYKLRVNKPFIVRKALFRLDAGGGDFRTTVFLRNETHNYFIIAPTTTYLIAQSKSWWMREPNFLDFSPGILFAPGDVWVTGSVQENSSVSGDTAVYDNRWPIALYGDEVIV